jgi:hypothetical protein
LRLWLPNPSLAFRALRALQAGGPFQGPYPNGLEPFRMGRTSCAEHRPPQFSQSWSIRSAPWPPLRPSRVHAAGFPSSWFAMPIAGLAPQPRSRGLVSTRPAVVRLVSPPPRVNPRPLQRSYPIGLEPFPMETTSCADNRPPRCSQSWSIRSAPWPPLRPQPRPRGRVSIKLVRYGP